MTASLGLSLLAFWQLLGLPAEARAVSVTVAEWIPSIPLQTHERDRRPLRCRGASGSIRSRP